MKPNEEIIGTLLVSLLVFGTQNRAPDVIAGILARSRA